ncbi:SURF1 family protein [Agarilytica rhodophyticola]|uniref:SURF1 family protein n=1 Tax=Agarilytica rhodophyticola TaxID=1737490 RepID=UPI000B348BF5|nr:SURF1 family protein [Agarilytica rhodophyticola]
MTANQKLTFDFNWKLTLSVVFLFPILLRLCFWQIERAEEKKVLAQQWKSQQTAQAIPLNEDVNFKNRRFVRVYASGKFLIKKYWLKENQIYNGQLGYNVIMPFASEDGEIVSVDRGWVLGSPRRDYVPTFETPANNVRITGVLVVPSDSKLIREAETRAKSWPHKILEVDIPILSRQSELELYPKLLRIDPDSPGALDVIWRPINASSAKHYGYAFQWGLMAVVLIIMYLFASTNLMQLLKGGRES